MEKIEEYPPIIKSLIEKFCFSKTNCRLLLLLKCLCRHSIGRGYVISKFVFL